MASLAGLAEQYAHADPASSLVKLRNFIEMIVDEIYRQNGIERPQFSTLIELLNFDIFKEITPKSVLDKFHSVRIHGNKAAHGSSYRPDKALGILREAHDLAKWFYITFGPGDVSDCPDFENPPAPFVEKEPTEQLVTERKALLRELAYKESKINKLIIDLKETRAKAVVAERKAEELIAIVDLGKRAADILEFDEKSTRHRLIDTMLTATNWNVGTKGKNTKEVTQEEEVLHQPTDTGIGYADYVLWDDNGKPLAVIEAKKTSADPEIGRKQAQLYADGLEKMHGQRPVIFYTNGYEIWIWDDAQGYPPRKLFGYYSKDSLQYLINFQRESKLPLDLVSHRPEIVNRLYQIESIKRVTEKFSQKRTKALIVQATGTGKTRVAIALTDILIRANWVKRVLFLCDRRELRKQAKNAYNDFIDEPMTIIKADTANDRNKRIYLGTYPAMMKIFETFDTGFFDLIISDESHRSIYNRYKTIFQYFDALQVGLTATPVETITRNTFQLFDCEENDPTFNYPLERAIEEEFLVPFEVYTHTTNFLREGIKYSQLTEEQKQQLEDDGEDPEQFDHDRNEIDRQIFNKDTNRAILRNLMENGIRDVIGQHPGKSIIFARNHRHAVLLQELFNDMYPQYGGEFCWVIDTYDPRAEQLIDDFKDKNNPLTIAISVDMLDTGIDILEIVNLVFAKPVKSYVKFWQMIGRGTRLCKDLFGPGQDKTAFRIFDHWGNFEYFDEKIKQAEARIPKSLMQRVFEARINLAETALNKGMPEEFKQIVALIQKDLASLPTNSLPVREKWKEVAKVSKPEFLYQFAPTTVAYLKNDVAPLLQWINIRRDAPAYEFDLLVAEMQNELLKKSGRFEDFKNRFLNLTSSLLMHLNPVREKLETLGRVKDQAFWDDATVSTLEKVRNELRGIIQYRLREDGPQFTPKTIDITDGDIEFAQRPSRLRTVDMQAYRRRVDEVLKPLFDKSPTLQKIRNGKPVSQKDLDSLISLVLTQNPNVDLNLLKEFYTETVYTLDSMIRSIVGMDTKAVKERFLNFVQKHPEFSAQQTSFLSLLQNHISKYGAIEIDKLYEAPFTTISSEGLDGAFPDESVANELVAIVESFQPKNIGDDRRL